MRILLIEDNEGLAKGIRYRLQDEGHAVDLFDNGLEADVELRGKEHELVVLDINLPGRDGLDVLRDMRARQDPRPVILLTARATTQDRVLGLDAGADDYLVKPFAMDELIARVRALGRRREVAPRRAISLGSLTLELEPPRLVAPDGPVDVPRRELSVLVALAEARGAALGKEQLLDHLYGSGSDVDEKVVEVYVSRLRKRLLRFDIQIRVTRGIGYALVTAQ